MGQLKLERFRDAENLSLDLDERLNVFVGMNGASKFSMLDATALLLSWLVNRIKSASGKDVQVYVIVSDVLRLRDCGRIAQSRAA